MLVGLQNKKLKEVKVYKSIPFKDYRGQLWTSWELRKINKNLFTISFLFQKKMF